MGTPRVSKKKEGVNKGKAPENGSSIWDKNPPSIEVTGTDKIEVIEATVVVTEKNAKTKAKSGREMKRKREPEKEKDVSVLEDEVIDATDTSLTILSSTIDEGSFKDVRSRRQKRKERRREEMKGKEKYKEKERDKRKAKERMKKMKLRRMRLEKIRLGRRLEFATISPAIIIVNSGLGEKDANFTIQKFASSSKRLDWVLMGVQGEKTAKTSIRKFAEVLYRGSLVIDLEGPATSSIQGSKGMETLEAENTPRGSIC